MHDYFVGLDVHKQVIAYCIKTASGEIVREGTIAATRESLDQWVATLPGPWQGGLEATMFSHWIYRHLQPHAVKLVMGHPARMKAISAAKKKSDKIDARTIADLLRCNMFPECFVISPELGALRQQLRFRRLLVAQTVRFKNKTAGLLMEAGVEYSRRRLHGKTYFRNLLEHSAWIDQHLRPLLEFNHNQIQSLRQMDRRIARQLQDHPQLQERVQHLRRCAHVGSITALTWALEVADPARFHSGKQAISYCGFTSALRESAGRQMRSPLSKQRNRHLQCMLVEAAKLAPRFHPTLAEVHRKALAKGAHKNRATLQVARKLVAYLLAADRIFFQQPALDQNSASTAVAA